MTNQNTVTDARKRELAEKGYCVEDMGEVWGDEYAGRYRWMLGDEEDWGDIEYSEQDAWLALDRFERESRE